jgi:hypothetical protein
MSDQFSGSYSLGSDQGIAGNSLTPANFADNQ